MRHPVVVANSHVAVVTARVVFWTSLVGIVLPDQALD